MGDAFEYQLSLIAINGRSPPATVADLQAHEANVPTGMGTVDLFLAMLPDNLPH